MVFAVFLSGCSSQKNPGGQTLPIAAGNENSLTFCMECTDTNSETIDLCKFNGGRFVSCEFLPRCGNSAFFDGLCKQAPVCGNKACETGEISSCRDCSEVTECSNGGLTGAGAVPKNLFAWGFDSVASNTCDADNPNHFNCDSLQALVSLIQKLQRVKEHLSSNDLPENAVELDGVGQMYQTNAGLMLKFKWALLSDNLSSTELLKDFDSKLEPGFLSRFSAPQWIDGWKPFIHSAGFDETPKFSVEYKKDAFQTVNLNPKLHTAGEYGVSVKIDFVGVSAANFGKLSGNSTIKVELEKQGPLRDSVVFDAAFDELLGIENTNRDYGIKWPAGSLPISISKKTTGSTDYFLSTVYQNGLNTIYSSDPSVSPVAQEATYFSPPAGIGHFNARSDVFFGNAPVLLQTNVEKGNAFPQTGMETGLVVEGQQTSIIYNSTVPVPLVAVVSPSATQVFGTQNILPKYALPQAWFRAADIGSAEKGCSDFQILNSGPVIGGLCGDASPDIFKTETGQDFNLSTDEILGSYPQGLILDNPSNKAGVYLNIAYVPVDGFFGPPVLKMCNANAEVSSLQQTLSGATSSFVLQNGQKKISSLAELFEKIKGTEVCVYKQVFYEDSVNEEGITTTASIEKTAYLWNVDKILQEIYPKVYNYGANHKIGSLMNC